MKNYFDGIFAQGIFIGLVLAIVGSLFFDGSLGKLANDKTWVAGIITAVIVALIGLIGVFMSIEEARNARIEARKDADAATVLEIFAKLQKIANNFYTLGKYVEDAYALVGGDYSAPNPAAFVRGLASHPERIEFTSFEKATLLRLGAHDQFGEISEIDDLHNSTIGAFIKYGELRERFCSTVPAEMDGEIGTSTFNEEEFRAIAPLLAEMNLLLNQIITGLKSDLLKAMNALQSFEVIVREHGKIKITWAEQKDISELLV
ncbi:hypothetical protein GCM10008927_00340 [Amylibacter ulvae]|uniref:Uncharacterized protein n=1 Tax=Paramylibacter ulvae TaxID=1651968 RepID=A0ABQ3CTK9_9RHOB|nr:hypothetical protein [Amylibacter ulvae]GHA40189.1 hypothetical protein GCM10008927_00340 [Amylibacter ulvae]